MAKTSEASKEAKAKKNYTQQGVSRHIAELYESYRIALDDDSSPSPFRNLSSFVVSEARRLAGSGMRGKADWELCQLYDAVRKFSSHNRRIRVFGRVCGILPYDGSLSSGSRGGREDGSGRGGGGGGGGEEEEKKKNQGWTMFPPYNAKADKVLFALLQRWIATLKSKTTVTELLEFDERDGKAWMVSKKCEKGCDELFSTCPAWTFDHLSSSLKDHKIPRPWRERRDELTTSLEGLRRSTKSLGFLSGELRGASRITNVDAALHNVIMAWFEEERALFQALENAHVQKLEREKEEYERKYQVLYDAWHRPWSPTETENLRRGVARFGEINQAEQNNIMWDAIIRHKPYDFIHRRPQDMQRYWSWVFAEDQRKEKRKWNWKLWPWNAAWDWGGLLVIPDGAPHDLRQRVDNLKGRNYELDEEDPDWREGDSSDDSAEFSAGQGEDDDDDDDDDNNNNNDDDDDDRSSWSGDGISAYEDEEERNTVGCQDARGMKTTLDLRTGLSSLSTDFQDMITRASPRLEDSAIRIQRHFRGRQGRLFGRFGQIPMAFDRSLGRRSQRAGLSPSLIGSINNSSLMSQGSDGWSNSVIPGAEGSEKEQHRFLHPSRSTSSLTLNMARNASSTSSLNPTATEGALVLNHWSVTGQELRGIAQSASRYSRGKASRIAKTKRSVLQAFRPCSPMGQEIDRRRIRDLFGGTDYGGEDGDEVEKKEMTITVIELRDNNINQHHADDLTLLLEAHREATSLDLAQNRIGENGCEALASWLRHPLSCIRELNLSANALGDRAMARLTRGLLKTHSLKEINLSNNTIGDNGAILLASYISSSSCTTSTILLPWNQIGSRGGMSLAEALANNSTVEICSLQFNNLGKIYGCFFTVLEHNTKLQFLDLSFNGTASVEDCTRMGEGLVLNESLMMFEFNGNDVTEAGARKLIMPLLGPCPTISGSLSSFSSFPSRPKSSPDSSSSSPKEGRIPRDDGQRKGKGKRNNRKEESPVREVTKESFTFHFLDENIPTGKNISLHTPQLLTILANEQRVGLELLQELFRTLDGNQDNLVSIEDLRNHYHQYIPPPPPPPPPPHENQTTNLDHQSLDVDSTGCKDRRERERMTTDEAIRWLGARMGKAILLPQSSKSTNHSTKKGTNNMNDRPPSSLGVSFPDFLSCAWEEALQYRVSVALTPRRYFEEASRMMEARREAKKKEILAALLEAKAKGDAAAGTPVMGQKMKKYKEQKNDVPHRQSSWSSASTGKVERGEQTPFPAVPRGLSFEAAALLRRVEEERRLPQGWHRPPLQISARSCHTICTPRELSETKEMTKIKSGASTTC